MISGFSSFGLLFLGLLQGSFFKKLSFETAGDFRQNGTQLVVNRISRTLLVTAVGRFMFWKAF